MRMLKSALALLLAVACLYAPMSSASAGILDFFSTPTPKPTPTSTPRPTPTPTRKPTPTPTPVPSICPYSIQTFNVGGTLIQTYCIEFGGAQWNQTVEYSDHCQIYTADASYYQLRGNIHDCIGLRIVVDFETYTKNISSIQWCPVVYLDSEREWSYGVIENRARMDERDRYVGDLIFWGPADFYYVSCIPAKNLKQGSSWTSYLGVEKMYFATPEAAEDYYYSLFN